MKIPNNKAIYLEKLIEDEDLSFVNGSKYVSNVIKKFDKVKSKNDSKSQYFIQQNLQESKISLAQKEKHQ